MEFYIYIYRERERERESGAEPNDTFQMVTDNIWK